MKFFFSPLVLLAVLFTSSFAAPTENALSKRALDFSFSSDYVNTGISHRDVEATVDEHRLSKRLLDFNFTLFGITNTLISFKRGSEEADEELSKRSEEYNLVVASLPPGNSISGRSTDTYEGRHVKVSASDAMVQGLQQIGVTQDQMPEYLSQALLVTDPDTGNQYQLVPSSDSTTPDIVLNLDYQPTSL